MQPMSLSRFVHGKFTSEIRFKTKTTFEMLMESRGNNLRDVMSKPAISLENSHGKMKRTHTLQYQFLKRRIVHESESNLNNLFLHIFPEALTAA